MAITNFRDNTEYKSFNNHKSASAGDHAVFFFKTPLLCKSYADMRAHSEN